MSEWRWVNIKQNKKLNDYDVEKTMAVSIKFFLKKKQQKKTIIFGAIFEQSFVWMAILVTYNVMSIER